MRVALLTGIYPPDIGGPATHAADLAAELRARDHGVVVVSLRESHSDGDDAEGVFFPREIHWARRTLRIVRWLYRQRRRYDIIYATGLHLEAVIGGALARRPRVVKIVGDPVWERGRRLGLSNQDFRSFQGSSGGPPALRLMRLVRDWSLRHADRVIVPSSYLREVVRNWLPGEDLQIEVIPNGVRVTSALRSKGRTGSCLNALCVGRLVPHKNVDVLLKAVSVTDDVTLTVVGTGPDRERLQKRAVELRLNERVAFLGSVSHEEVMSLLQNSDLLLSASDYEGLPHVAIESLACGTPVIATGSGGMREVIEEGSNGYVVDANASAISEVLRKLAGDRALLDKLSTGAAKSASAWTFDRTVESVEDLLRRTMRKKPRLISLGKTYFPEPLGDDLEQKLNILGEFFRGTVVGVGKPSSTRHAGIRVVRLPRLSPGFLGGMLFYSLGPIIAVALAAGRSRSAVVCQSPYEALLVALLGTLVPARWRPKLVVEVHGDWRTATRLYGHPLRRTLSPLTDRLAPWVLRRADRVRVVGEQLRELVISSGYKGEIDRYVTFSDFSMFLAPNVVPLPESPQVAFAGVFQPYKAVDVLVKAWAEVCRSVPKATLTLAGDGPIRLQIEQEAARLGIGATTQFVGSLARPDLVKLLDDSSFLVLPSRSEGLPRVIFESFARGRPVVATPVGDIPIAIKDGVTGILVPVEDPTALAVAMIKLLSDGDLLQTMGRAARRHVEYRDPAREFVRGTARLAAWLEQQDLK